MLKIKAKDSGNKVDNLEYAEPEIWKYIEGYEGKYKVSNKGRVKTCNKTGVNDTRYNYYRTMSLVDRGLYKAVNLCYNGERNMVSVHRLVAKYFVSNPNNKPCVNHLDGDKHNNFSSNLEWVTFRENDIHAFETGLRESPKGSNNGLSKLNECEVLEIRSAYNLGCFTQKEIATAYNVAPSCISAIITRRTWTHV